MNPIVSTGRHHNERPFTGRHQMSSCILSRGFVRDTFNSPLALCLVRWRLWLSSFPGCSAPRHPTPAIFSLLYPSRVLCRRNSASRRGKRQKTARKRAFVVRVVRVEGTKGDQRADQARLVAGSSRSTNRHCGEAKLIQKTKGIPFKPSRSLLVIFVAKLRLSDIPPHESTNLSSYPFGEPATGSHLAVRSLRGACNPSAATWGCIPCHGRDERRRKILLLDSRVMHKCIDRALAFPLGSFSSLLGG